jgi:leucyl-tRNA synthetase
VVNPDDLVETYGTDSLRLYELFIGPPEVDSEWDDNGIEGVYRFINRTWNIVNDNIGKTVPMDLDLKRTRNRLIKDVSERLEGFRFNTVVSAFMSYVNYLYDRANSGIDQESMETLSILLAPFAPHLAEELWSRLGHGESVFKAKWPTWDDAVLEEESITVPVQVNGRLKATLQVAKNLDQSSVLSLAKSNDAVSAAIEGKQIVKEIYVPGKIVNFVVK